MRKLIPILLLASLAACADNPLGVAENEVVRVAEETSGIRITNLTDTPRAYLANDPEWLAVALSMPLDLIALCNTPDAACLRLPAKGSVLMPYAEVGGYGSSTKSIVVFTWRVVPVAPGQYQTEMDQAVTLKL